MGKSQLTRSSTSRTDYVRERETMSRLSRTRGAGGIVVVKERMVLIASLSTDGDAGFEKDQTPFYSIRTNPQI